MEKAHYDIQVLAHVQEPKTYPKTSKGPTEHIWVNLLTFNKNLGQSMPKYYMLECYGPDDEERAGMDTVQGLKGFNWMLGQKFSQTVPTPIHITMDPDSGIMMPVFKRGILLFSDEFLSALKEGGVHNLDCYDTDLFNPFTNQHYNNYKAINIIGLVSVADLANSQIETHGKPLIDVDFDSLSIDQSKTHNLYLFRLAECVSGIVVHEKVKSHIEKCGIKYIDWVEPEDWMG